MSIPHTLVLVYQLAIIQPNPPRLKSLLLISDHNDISYLPFRITT